MTPEKLKDALRNFTGTEGYLRYNPLLFPRLVLTDGAQFLAEEAGAYWLMDMVGSYLPEIPADEHFVLVRYAGTPGSSGLFSMTDDDPANQTYTRQSVEYSNFPLDEIRLYLTRQEGYWVLLLTSEY